MRQLALLTVIRKTLPPDGESAKIIRGCKHAGGTILNTTTNAHDDQALMQLDRRWQSAVASDVDFGVESKSLSCDAVAFGVLG